MAGIFDLIPLISVILFTLGLVGVVIYEKTHAKQSESSV